MTHHLCPLSSRSPVLRALLALTSSPSSCSRGIAFEGMDLHTLSSTPSPHSPTISFLFLLSSARSGKADAVRASYTKYGDRVEIVVIDDLINGDFTDVLKDVYGVIHVASPFPGRQDLRTTIDVSICFLLHLSLPDRFDRSVVPVPHVPRPLPHSLCRWAGCTDHRRRSTQCCSTSLRLGNPPRLFRQFNSRIR